MCILIGEQLETTNIWNVSFDDIHDDYFLEFNSNESDTTNVTNDLRYVYSDVLLFIHYLRATDSGRHYERSYLIVYHLRIVEKT